MTEANQAPADPRENSIADRIKAHIEQAKIDNTAKEVAAKEAAVTDKGMEQTPIIRKLVVSTGDPKVDDLIQRKYDLDSERITMINMLSGEIQSAALGRNESEIPLNDSYWTIRAKNHQLIWKLEGK